MLNNILVKTAVSESKKISLLALPLIGTGLLEQSISFFSTLFLAHLSKEALASGALAGAVFATFMVIMWGTLSAVSTLVAHRYGANDVSGIVQLLKGGLKIALIAIIPAMILIWNLAPALLWLGQNPETVDLTKIYLHSLAWAIIPDAFLTVLLHFLVGIGQPKRNLFFTALWVPMNVVFNYLFIFGKLGFPACGIAGIGWGTTTAFTVITLILAVYMLISNDYKIYRQHFFSPAKFSTIKELLKLGLPIGSMFCIEVAFFTSVTVLMGTLGKEILAANQITFQYLFQFSTISFCIAGACTVRMGHLLGANDKSTATVAGYTTMLLTLCMMSVVAFVYWIFPHLLISIDFSYVDKNNSAIISLAKKFLGICAVFQIFESIRIAAFGALRALKDTRFSMLVSILTFWGIALPLGYFLATAFSWQGQGIWTAMVISQMLGAGILVKRFQNKIKI